MRRHREWKKKPKWASDREGDRERERLTGFLVGGWWSCCIHLAWVRCWGRGRGSISCLHRYWLVRWILRPLIDMRLSERCTRLRGVLRRAGDHRGVGGGGDHRWKATKYKWDVATLRLPQVSFHRGSFSWPLSHLACSGGCSGGCFFLSLFICSNAISFGLGLGDLRKNEITIIFFFLKITFSITIFLLKQPGELFKIFYLDLDLKSIYCPVLNSTSWSENYDS